jgi:hypothetical protein
MNNFILESSMKDLSICDELIELHKNSPYKTPGTLGNIVDINRKHSTDIVLPDGELALKYLPELYNSVNEYVEKYSYSNSDGKWTINEYICIQHYAPGEGFHVWHAERTHDKMPEIYRHLVFMTYLNDVDDGGETEFFYQNVKFKPQKGKTLMWPADWTHTHRGITSLTQEKYIITGWFSYY